MAHPKQIEFCQSVKERFPQYFKGVSVLDMGSLDINGNNRYLFEDYTYIGVDLGPGKNVDVVCQGHDFRSDEHFDTVISTECFEHDDHWVLTLTNMYRHLKSGGLLLFCCATDGRPEHGTRRREGWASPYTLDYYGNLNEKMMRKYFDFDEMFSDYEFSTNPQCFDLYFWGIKN